MLIDPYHFASIVYSAWNPADKDADVVLAFGDRLATISTSTFGAVRGVAGHDASGTFAFEVLISGDDRNVVVGVGKSTASIASYPGADADGFGYYGIDGNKYTSGSGAAYGSLYAPGDRIGVLLSGGDLTFYLNGTSLGVAFTGLSGTYYPMWSNGTSASGVRSGTINTGQESFTGALSGSTVWG